MKPTFSILLMVTLVFGGGYWYYTAFAGCDVPIAYRIGSIDQQFGLREDEARMAVSVAESLWEDGTGRNLFTYSEDGELVINFVYDERQERANEEEKLREVLEHKEGVSDSVKTEYDLLISQYDALRTSYEKAVLAYESKLIAYNEEVAEWNDRGGAPKDVFERLNETEGELKIEEKRLSGLATQLNTLVRRINLLGSQGNNLITDYNSLVSEYNNKFTESQEFTQGEYVKRTITIFEYGSKEELSLVLAHELGHALGIEHVDGKDSIMFHFMEAQDLGIGLTESDRGAFQALCGEPTSFNEAVRLFARSFDRLLSR